MTKTLILSALVALVVAVGGVSVFGPKIDTDALVAKVAEKVNFGVANGGDFFFPVSFKQTATIGGGVFATSSTGTVTYTAGSFTNTSLIQHTAATAVTATLPASSTLASSFAPNAGDVRTIMLAPITSNITLAGGTGTDLNTASSTKVCLNGQICRLDFVRKSNSDFEVLLTTASGN